MSKSSKKPKLPPMPNMTKVNAQFQEAIKDADTRTELDRLAAAVHVPAVKAAILIGLDNELDAAGFVGILFGIACENAQVDD